MYVSTMLNTLNVTLLFVEVLKSNRSQIHTHNKNESNNGFRSVGDPPHIPQKTSQKKKKKKSTNTCIYKQYTFNTDIDNIAFKLSGKRECLPLKSTCKYTNCKFSDWNTYQ